MANEADKLLDELFGPEKHSLNDNNNPGSSSSSSSSSVAATRLPSKRNRLLKSFSFPGSRSPPASRVCLQRSKSCDYTAAGLGFMNGCLVWLEGFSRIRERIQLQNINKHGGSLATSRERATHIVLAVMAANRTRAADSVCSPAVVVTEDWLVHSLMKGQCLPVTDYAPPSSTVKQPRSTPVAATTATISASRSFPKHACQRVTRFVHCNQKLAATLEDIVRVKLCMWTFDCQLMTARTYKTPFIINPAPTPNSLSPFNSANFTRQGFQQMRDAFSLSSGHSPSSGHGR